MKKILLTILFLIFITGCQTQEERELKKEKQRVDEITKEVEKNTEIPEEAKTWMIDNKSKTVLTILCLKTSNRCVEIQKGLAEYEKEVKIYYIEFDDLDENIKDIYKKTYELDNYTGYLPYVYLVSNNKLIKTNSKVKDITDIKNMLIENKIVSE